MKWNCRLFVKHCATRMCHMFWPSLTQSPTVGQWTLSADHRTCVRSLNALRFWTICDLWQNVWQEQTKSRFVAQNADITYAYLSLTIYVSETGRRRSVFRVKICERFTVSWTRVALVFCFRLMNCRVQWFAVRMCCTQHHTLRTRAEDVV